MSIQIPDDVYLEADIYRAQMTLFEAGVTPEQYKQFYDEKFGKQYEADAIADAKTDPEMGGHEAKGSL